MRLTGKESLESSLCSSAKPHTFSITTLSGGVARFHWFFTAPALNPQAQHLYDSQRA